MGLGIVYEPASKKSVLIILAFEYCDTHNIEAGSKYIPEKAGSKPSDLMRRLPRYRMQSRIISVVSPDFIAQHGIRPNFDLFLHTLGNHGTVFFNQVRE